MEPEIAKSLSILLVAGVIALIVGCVDPNARLNRARTNIPPPECQDTTFHTQLDACDPASRPTRAHQKADDKAEGRTEEAKTEPKTDEPAAKPDDAPETPNAEAPAAPR